jgi:hypothetical protein
VPPTRALWSSRRRWLQRQRLCQNAASHPCWCISRVLHAPSELVVRSSADQLGKLRLLHSTSHDITAQHSTSHHTASQHGTARHYTAPLTGNHHTEQIHPSGCIVQMELSAMAAEANMHWCKQLPACCLNCWSLPQLSLCRAVAGHRSKALVVAATHSPSRLWEILYAHWGWLGMATTVCVQSDHSFPAHAS